MVESEIALVVQGSSVVQGCAVIELVEGHDVIRIWVSQGQVSYEPACTVTSQKTLEVGTCADLHLHEACSSSNHNILDIWQRLIFGATSEDWGLLPHSKVLEELVRLRVCWNRRLASCSLCAVQTIAR